MKHLFLIVTLLLSLPVLARSNIDSIRIYYQRGYGIVEPQYMENAKNLSILNSWMDDSLSYSFFVTPHISPDGSPRANRRLQTKRGKSLDAHLRAHGIQYQLCDSIGDYTNVFRHLLQLVSQSAGMPYRDETVAVLNGYLCGQHDGGFSRMSILGQLKALHQGVPYRWIAEHLYPLMRYTDIVRVCNENFGPCPYEIKETSISLASSIHPVHPQSQLPSLQPLTAADHDPVERGDKFYLGVKTNLLSDALLIPNLGLEFAFSRHWSAAVSWSYAWWKNDGRHRYWRVYGGDAELRYWMGRKAALKPLQGHHIGLYGQMLTYDIEWGGKGYLGDKWSYGVGLSYGYSLPLCRRLNMDFSLGIGYLGGKYKEYVPMDDCYVWQSTKNRHYFGPTKAEVSLVWLIGRHNFNQKEGKQ